MKRDMRRKENKQVLGNASKRDAYEQEGRVTLRDTSKEEKPIQQKGTSK